MQYRPICPGCGTYKNFCICNKVVPMNKPKEECPVIDIVKGSKKNDQGKADLSILSFAALTEIAKAFEFGSRKYGRYNYLETGFEYTRVASALLRHMYAWIWGEDLDPESGLTHLAHVGACVVMLLDHLHHKIGTDNRFKKGKK